MKQVWRMTRIIVSVWVLFTLAGCGVSSKTETTTTGANTPIPTTIENQNWREETDVKNLREIYYAGGCFWGVNLTFPRYPGSMT